ncbi:MAG: DNA gyrase subunit A [Promethearchaeota archaeon]
MSTDKIREVILKEEMESSYIDYAMSVVIGRAIPDVRDGLKPVHRRIVYAMADNNYVFNRPHVKSARTVGTVLGMYHPHGDLAVYNALVRMGQDFSLRYPLIDPQGNFGSIDGDPPAAMRYTEARLSQIANEIIEDINKDTVEFQPNFDDSLEEPRYMPSKLPNILINGTKGIAVGMATSMPPHNLKEVCEGIIATIDDPEISLEELMEIIKGPDFPTGGIVTNPEGIYNAYFTGAGKIVIRGKVEIEKKGKDFRLVITEIPYLLNKTVLLESIARLIRDGVLKDVRDMRDESDRRGMRIVLDLKKGAQPEIIKNILFKRTRLLSNFNVINLVLINDGKQPKILTLRELIQEYIDHRLNIIVRRTQFDLKKAEDRLHIVDGLLIALNDIDNVINIIKSAKDTNEARDKLIEAYELSEVQVRAILSMPLSRLTNLEQQKLVDEQKELKNTIRDLKKILKSKAVQLSIIKQELTDLCKKYGDDRKTEIIEELTKEKEIETKDLVKKEPTIVILSNNNYIKRISLKEYKSQGRGGRGKKGMTVRDEDFIKDLFVASTHDTILFFTNKGRVYSKRCFEIPLQQRTAKGKPIVNLLSLKTDEDIAEMIPIHSFDTNDMLIMVTENGIIKKTPSKLFSKIKKTGIRAQKIRPDDKLVSVRRMTNELQDIFLATKFGYAIRFDESELRELGRNTMGVKGAYLRKADKIIGSLLVTDEEYILTLTKNGKAQKTKMEEYRKTGRGAKGVINITLDGQDEVIATKLARDEDILIGSEQGQVIRTPVEEIRLTHRKSKGVRVMKLYKGDSVVAIGACAHHIDNTTKK